MTQEEEEEEEEKRSAEEEEQDEKEEKGNDDDGISPLSILLPSEADGEAAAVSFPRAAQLMIIWYTRSGSRRHKRRNRCNHSRPTTCFYSTACYNKRLPMPI
ncbi:hypothetical protein E2C01_058712 [Portunus trituberculatus]|uniref:Uncharacterized protein n=1 Tax=Portunus trituberculatus TaxID=210409 RepID=A0A5B7H6X5_PORTR|nr:hypothetical protein [Portunus trituberculatus]